MINVARGALVDEEALVKALRDGKIAGAGIDVFGKEPPDLNDPIFALPNVVISAPRIVQGDKDVSGPLELVRDASNLGQYPYAVTLLALCFERLK